MKTRVSIFLFVSFLVLSNTFVVYATLIPDKIGLQNTWHEIYLDVDRLPDGQYIVAGFPMGGLPVFNSINTNTEMNRIYIISNEGKITWSHTGLYFPHEVELITSGYTNTPAFIIANAADGGIDQISYPNHELEWQWLPERINWTKIIPFWGPNSQAMNYSNDYGHFIVNDVDFIPRSLINVSYDSLLISIKRINLVVLVNYSAEMNELLIKGDKYGSTENINWYFGPTPEGSIINQQHNPDILPNGNVIICDSENNRIIEVNRTNKEIIWSLKQANNLAFRWVKDADYIPETNTFLVTDSGNNRILEIDYDGNVKWEFQNQDLLIPYEADLLSNNHILISGGGTGVILEISRETQKVFWRFQINSINPSGEYHFNFVITLIRWNFCIIGVIFLIQSIKSRQIYKKSLQNVENELQKTKKNKKIGLFKLIFWGLGSIGCFLIVIYAQIIYIWVSTQLMLYAVANSPQIPSLFTSFPGYN